MEKRTFSRSVAAFPVELKIKGNHSEAQAMQSGETVNLSEGGLCMTAKCPVSVSSLLDLSINLAPQYHPIRTQARVLWSLCVSSDDFQLGVRFIRLQDDDLSIVRELLRNLNLQYKVYQSSAFVNAVKYSRKYLKSAADLKAQGYYFYMRRIDSASQRETVVKGRRMIMLGSNNYLGLTTHPRVKEAAIKAIDKYGVGSGGVPMLSGTFDLHEKLEQKLAEFKKTEACIIYSSGFVANVGAISTLLGKDDLAILDEKVHASILDGCKMARCRVRVFKHNDMRSLEKVLRCYGTCKGHRFIIVDGVYSMDGDIANLAGIKQLARKYDTALMVDDAHATGVIGRNGRGTAEHFGLEGEIDVVVGTLSKSLAGVGGFVCSSHEIVSVLKYAGRPFIFSTSLPPVICASIMAAIEVIQEEPQLLDQLWRNVRYIKEGLQKLGYDIGQSESAIIPVIIGDEKKMNQMVGELENLGIFVSPVAPPAVKKGTSRIRVSVMASHCISDLNRALDAFRIAGRKLDVI